MLQVHLRFGADDLDDGIIARRRGQRAPKAAAGRPLAAEEAEANRRRELVDGGAAVLGLDPARERSTADAAGVDETLARIADPCRHGAVTLKGPGIGPTASAAPGCGRPESRGYLFRPGQPPTNLNAI